MSTISLWTVSFTKDFSTKLFLHIIIVNDTYDLFFFCVSSVKVDSNEGFLRSGKWPVLTVFSAGHALHVFINGQLSGTVYGSLENPKITFSDGVNLKAGVNKISLLSIAVGLPVCALSLSLSLPLLMFYVVYKFDLCPLYSTFVSQNVGPHFETWNAGVLGPVSLNGLNKGKRDLTWQKWSYKVCLCR